MAAFEAIHVSNVPNNLDLISKNAAFMSFSAVDEEGGKFIVMGHRGSGMNVLESCDPRMKCYKENSIRSFNHAAQFNLHFVEFDVQVTKDDCPVIFHDIHIITKHEEVILEKRVTDLTLQEFLNYGPQNELGKEANPLLRKSKDGSLSEWKVEIDDPLCTLEEAYRKVDKSIGFNIELKFDDHLVYDRARLERVLQSVLKITYEHAEARPVMFSSFQPDAALLMRELQDRFPVFFLTNGGCEIYGDSRRNSLEEAVKLCLEAGLDGIVSQVKAVLKNPTIVTKIKDSKLTLLTYGQLNNVPEVVYVQRLMCIEGVIADFVQEIKEASVSQLSKFDGGEVISSCLNIDGNGTEEKAAISVAKILHLELQNVIPELVVSDS